MVVTKTKKNEKRRLSIKEFFTCYSLRLRTVDMHNILCLEQGSADLIGNTGVEPEPAESADDRLL